MRGSILEFANNQISFQQKRAIDNMELWPELPPKALSSMTNIILEGETGTGKTHLAKLIHKMSGGEGRLVHLNLAACSPNLIESELFGHVKGAFTGAIYNHIGAFEMAHRGTLFLDEIDSLPWEIQTKLLIVLESMEIRPVGAEFVRKIDMRIIFASSRPLVELVENKILREDLYYRINRGLHKKLPSLRESPHLLEKVVLDFLQKYNLNCCPRLLDYYKTLNWPGNIRQLLGHLEKKGPPLSWKLSLL